MSIEHMSAVLHHSKAKGTHKLVLLGIANHEGDGGAYPSIATLSRYANVHARNVQRSITWLVERGELRVWLQDGDPRKPDHERTNRYAVLVTCPPWCDRTPHHRDTRRRQVGHHSGLWIEGVANPPGGGESARGGMAPAPPGGVAPAPPKPPTQPSHPPVSTSGTDRAREEHAPCGICDQNPVKCQVLQLTWPTDDRHAYTPRTRTNASR